MRLRAQSYRNLEGQSRTSTWTPWYWQLLAVAAPVKILGGFLMLQITFSTDTTLRVSSLAIGIFALAILLAGICSTILACVVVHDLTFQMTEVFRPALISFILGFLTIFYNMIISRQYVWNVPAIITTVAAGSGAVVYALLFAWTQRKIKTRNVIPPHISIHQDDAVSEAATGSWQSPEYYQNYVKNMYPMATASYAPSVVATTAPPASVSLTEDEMQRQQMLQLLSVKEQAPQAGAQTFHIEWQGPEHDHDTPIHARGNGTLSAASTRTTASLSMRVPGALMPWDGVWRGIAQRPEHRERRRQQIEQGM